MNIAIIGAGITGLTTALALARKGHRRIRIYEQAAELAEIGAGIQLAPNAVRLLHELGLKNALAQLADCSPGGDLRRGVNDRRLARLPYGNYFRRSCSVPAYQMLRTDLQAVLLAAVGAQGIGIELDKRHTGTQQTASGVVLQFADGSEAQADLLIGADGLGSVVARDLFPEHPPEYSGFACWRALVPRHQLGADWIGRVSVWTQTDAHLVAYPVGHGSQLNLVGTVRRPDWPGEQSQIDSSSEDWQQAFAGFCPRVQKLIEKASVSSLWGLFERRNLPAWHSGTQVLVGDAAHAMLPNLAQGAAQGIEDALALAEILPLNAEPPALESLLAIFYARRHERVARVQAGARWNLEFFHRPPGLARSLRDGLMQAGGPLVTRAIAAKYHWLYARSQ